MTLTDPISIPSLGKAMKVQWKLQFQTLQFQKAGFQNWVPWCAQTFGSCLHEDLELYISVKFEKVFCVGSDYITLLGTVFN